MTSLPRLAVNNPILANLLMIVLLGGGAWAGLTLVREMFPPADPNRVVISAVYPGATPVEVEKGIAIKIEEVIKEVEQIEEVNTSVGEGFCTITARLYSEVDDVDQAVTDIKAAIDTIPRDDFPAEAEEVQVVKFEPRLPVINVAFYGDLDDKSLKQVGREIRDDLLAVPGITDVLLQGTRKDEISVEVHHEMLLKYGISFVEVAEAINRANLDLPGGQIRTGTANVAVRTLGERRHAEPIADIILRSDPAGGVVRVRDVADVIDGFEDTDLLGRFNAQPGINCTVFKTANQDAIDIARKVKAYVAGRTHQPRQRDWKERVLAAMGIAGEIEAVYQRAWANPLRAQGTMTTSTDLSRFIEGRLDLLKRNGLAGLVLVFLSLFLFLNWRVAVWVMTGLLVSILGTLIAMQITGATLNLISMLGMILVLGMLVDDAIIVGEHVFSHVERGLPPREAAVLGTERVTWPVVCAITTTIVAFVPLLWIEGQIGDFMGVLPVIVMCALLISLLEALTILPVHLAHWLHPVHQHDPAAAPPTSRFGRFRVAFRRWRVRVLHDGLQRLYERALVTCISHRYVTLAGLLAMALVALGLTAGGRVPVVFVQKMDSETLLADLKMPVGTPMSGTDAAIRVVEQAGVALPELQSMYTVVGVHYGVAGDTAGQASHLGQVILELKTVEQRDRSSEDILRELRDKTGRIPGANSLRYQAMQGGPGGAAIQVEISGDRIDDLIAAADALEKELRSYDGVFDIDNNFDAGRREVQIELLESGRALGLTTSSLATQVRAAFYGLEARKVQRGPEDVKIMVRYPLESRRQVYDVESMWVAAPDGTLVPFTEVARIREGTGFASIKRKDRHRTVTITADVDEAVANARRIRTELAASFPSLAAEYPGLKIEYGGEAREFAKSFGSLQKGFVIAIALIYVILAALFKSYLQPLIVLTAVPFGLIGVVAGHLVLGYPITIMSLIGLVALTGIVVNDSLILVDFINERRRDGADPLAAVVDAGRARLRAILLTSITTILGLAPLLAETSFQAKFLIPLAIAIAGGLTFSTILTLVGVPTLYLIVGDLKAVGAALVRWAWTGPTAPQRTPVP